MQQAGGKQINVTQENMTLATDDLAACHVTQFQQMALESFCLSHDDITGRQFPNIK